MSTVKSAYSSIHQAQTVRDVVAEFRLLTAISAPQTSSAESFGVMKQSGVSIERTRKAANAEAEAVLNRVQGDSNKLTPEDKELLRKYSGLGGIGGSIHEYYTPEFVAQGMYDGLREMGFSGGNILEPSAGSGVFNANKPGNAIMTATEISGTSSVINQLLHPEDLVLNQPFETLAVEMEDDTFDSVVGNVPFGSTRGEYGAIDQEYSHIKYVDQYFVTRIIDKIKPGGLICVIVPPRIIERERWSDWRENLSRKAEFLGAHKLPTGTFSNNGTETVTDVLVMRKHSAELADRLAELSDDDLVNANVLWPTFINGKWFKSAEGKKFIHGTMNVLDTGARKITMVDGGNLTGAGIKQRLAHKFTSRIDHGALDVAETQTFSYAEGDEKLINGRWRRFTDGKWELAQITGSDGDSLDSTLYGAKSLSALNTMLRNNPAAFLELDNAQLLRIHKDFPYLTKGIVANAIKLASKYDEKHQDRLIRGTIIGSQIQDMLAQVNETDHVPTATAAEIRNLVGNETARFGIAANDRSIATLSGRDANYWNSFARATDKDGNFSDLMTGNIERGGVRAFDSTDATQTIAHLFGQLDMNPVPLEEFNKVYTGSTPVTFEDLAKSPGVAIDPAGFLSPMDRATSGNIVKRSNALKLAMANETNPDILDNYQRQLDEIERKRFRTPVDAIQMNMTAKWMPRELVKEFLDESGYSDVKYSKVVETEDGEQKEDTGYQGIDGTWSGAKDSFDKQLQNRLNGAPVRSSDAAAAAAYRRRIKAIDDRFGIWLRQHDNIEQITDLYNDTFNGYIEVEHDDSDLKLEGISGDIKNFDYQNSEIRRLSESGRGICGFGTGLGKSFTALGLVAYNTQLGRSKRTAIVVPKSVIENWYHETKAFYGAAYMDRILFTSIEPVTNDKGVEREHVLDENGEQRINKHTGKPEFRDKIKMLSGAAVKERLNQIPHSNLSLIVMTKEHYSSIPLRPESVEEHVSKMVDQGMMSGKYVVGASKHKEAMKNENFKAKYADTGTTKALDIPYFEDMGIDSVIVDEAHAYRNSYNSGYEASRLANLPTSSSAKSAIDMALKNQYLRTKFNGRGPVLLTATPTVNSPTDIFNMLSHVMNPEEWTEYGITDVDDFINVFGQKDEVLVQKLSGEVEAKEGLVGFKNLSGLRGLFHKWVNLKDAKDVSETVKIPDIEDINQEVPMTEQQQVIYEELRQRADALSKASEKEREEAQDSIFSIIRDMDRVTTDMDLYNRTMTFNLPADDENKLKALADALPETKRIKVGKTTITHSSNPTVSVDSNTAQLVVHEAFEDDVVKALKKHGINAADVSHPVTPKYARLIENLKNGLKDGKQIIFTDEKSQHNKLKRILVHHLKLEPKQIGIINADSIKGKGRTTQADIESGVAGEKEAVGLENIALSYNEGRHTILICNKKAEVGVNLHHGTTDMHHLTLPWTPSSIRQRNGRGARIGSKQGKVRAHYYVGKGSFDEFRLETLKRKANWMQELFTSDAEEVANADADSAEDVGLLLAPDPEERARRVEENRKKALEKIAKAERDRANIDLNNFLKASHDRKGVSAELLRSQEQALTSLKTLEEQIEHYQSKADRYSGFLADNPGTMERYYSSELKEARGMIKALQNRLPGVKKTAKQAERQSARANSAETRYRKLRPVIEQAIKNGSLKLDIDVLDKGSEFIISESGNTVRVGDIYNVKGFDGSAYGNQPKTFAKVVQIVSINWEQKSTQVKVLYSGKNSDSAIVESGEPQYQGISTLKEKTSFTPTELDLMRQMMKELSLDEAVRLLDKEQFAKYLVSGELNLAPSTYLLHDGDGYSFEDASYSGLEDDKKPLVVYPDSKNARLKADLAKWVLADRKNREPSSYRAAEEFFAAIYGDQPLVAIESYGVAASDAHINAWVGKMALSAMDDPKVVKDYDNVVKNGSKYGLEYEIKRFANRNIPDEFDNKTAFEDAISQISAIVTDKASVERVAFQKREKVALDAAFNSTYNDSKEKILTRTKWMLNQHTGSNPFSTMGNIRREKENPYTTLVGESYAVAAMIADLSNVMEKPFAIESLKWGEYARKFESLGYDFLNKGMDYIIEYKREPDDTDAEEEAKNELQEEALQTLDSVTDSEFPPALNHYTIRRNPTAVTKPAWRRIRAQDFDAFSLLGIQDPDGKSGKLFKSKSKLQGVVGPKNLFFANDIDTQYPGAWWFMPGDTDINELVEILGM